MATKLLKSVVRELIGTDFTGRNIIVTLEPGDMISFRTKRSKKAFYEVSLHHCFKLAMIMTQEKQYKEDMKQYNTDKKLGIKRRKPKRMNVKMFNPLYRKAI